MKKASNGFWFAAVDKSQPKIYNADMVLYFLGFLLTHRRYPSPNQRIDSNATISDNMLTQSQPAKGNLPFIFPFFLLFSIIRWQWFISRA